MRARRPDVRFVLVMLFRISACSSISALTMVSGVGPNPAADRLQSANPPWQASVEEEKQGRELLAKVIKALMLSAGVS